PVEDPGTGPTAPFPPPRPQSAPVAAPPVVSRPVRPKRPPSVLVPATLSMLVLIGGVLALVRVPVAVGLAILLLVTGGAMVIGAWRGRARWLIPVAIVLGVATAAASVLDVPLTGEGGDRTYRPTTVAELRP